jgi:gluconate kinase
MMERGQTLTEIVFKLALKRAERILARNQLRKCVECGTEFVVLHGNQRYCSARCRRRRQMREYLRRKRKRERVETS